ncbi:hypothetical protein LZ31DRAFT_504516 [Colletotrichum somersetense]|nr:hypothetical protein LZ31DRAFT_504516 [Colletotrichum somersetense]
MEFTLTFGAVGDFIAVIEIVRNIIVALDDCRGSAKEYRVVVQSLEILEKTLQSVANLYNDQSPASGLGDLKAIVLRNVEQIHLCLQAFSEKVQKFAPSLSTGGTKNVLKDVARKIQWKLEEKDVEKFRAEIVGYTMSLNVLLEVTTARAVQRNHETSTQQATDSENRTALRIRNSNQSLKGYFGMIGRRILSRLDSVSRLGMELNSSTFRLISMVLTMSAQLSSIRTVIMRLERPISEEYFTFEDATGKLFPIHLRTVTSWEAFEYIIADKFKGRKGAHRTQRRRYSLQERASGRAVDRSLNWESAFLPYQKIDMSLMCREAEKTALTKSSPSCPRCSTVSPGETGVEVQCSNCGMFFTRVVEVDEEDLPDALGSPRLNREARFGESGFYIATAGAAKRPREDEDFEKEQSCTGEKPKKRREQESRKRKATKEEPESDSDDEDVRGFVRITLIANRRRVHHPISPFYADQIESFDSVAQKVLGNKTVLSIVTSPFDVSSVMSSSFGSMSAGTKLQLSGATFQTSRDNPQGGDEEDKAEKAKSEPTNPNATDDDDAILQATVSLKKYRQATETDAKMHRIPPVYPLKNWAPDLLGSVFDFNSIGKWIYDWSAFHYGPATSVSDMAAELWLLLIEVAGRIKRSNEVLHRITVLDEKDMLQDFIESGERLTGNFRKLLKTCETPELKALKKDSSLDKNEGIEFIETLFGLNRELGKTERLMEGCRLFNLRFDANCERVLRNLANKENKTRRTSSVFGLEGSWNRG